MVVHPLSARKHSGTSVRGLAHPETLLEVGAWRGISSAPRRGAGRRSGGLLFPLERENGGLVAQDHAVGDLALLDPLQEGNLVHDVEHRVLDDRTQAARTRLAAHRLAGDGTER